MKKNVQNENKSNEFLKASPAYVYEDDEGGKLK